MIGVACRHWRLTPGPLDIYFVPLGLAYVLLLYTNVFRKLVVIVRNRGRNPHSFYAGQVTQQLQKTDKYMYPVFDISVLLS